MNVIDYLKNEDIHFIECKNWNNIYGYEKSQMKKDTINYIEQLQRENKHLDKVNCHLRKNYGQLEKENQGLKKQLQIKHDGFMASTDELCECAVENDRLKNQQKEFIKYLEDEIEACNLTQNLIFNKIKETKIYKEILQKYKEIIGLVEEV